MASDSGERIKRQRIERRAQSVWPWHTDNVGAFQMAFGQI
jgi:hypothetical protein